VRSTAPDISTQGNIMKSKLLALAFAASAATSAFAGPVASLPTGPLYIKFDNREQIAINGASTGYAYAPGEINWGVLLVSTMNPGNVTGVNTIESTGSSFFSNITSNNAQITGIFYGAQSTTSVTGNPFPATSGFIDLYWRDLSIYSATDISTTAPTVRTGLSTATGHTEGTLLAHLAFANGIITGDPTVFIAGSVAPTGGSNFAGLATSYANVDTSTPGAYTTALNSDFFTTAYGTRDLRFRNIYEELTSWNGGTNVLGARSTDPATAYVVPEPASLALVGVALLGLAVTSRRKQG
jgi:hypothetical protein